MGLLSALVGGAVSAWGTRQTNKANSQISQRDREFSERMSNTSYQRGMSDMRKAGLNPILAYKQGGASAPSASGIAAQNVGSSAVSGAVSSAASALAHKTAEAQIGSIHASTDAARASATKDTTQSAVNNINARLGEQQFKINMSSAESAKNELEYLQTQTGKLGTQANKFFNQFNPFVNSAKSLSRK